MKKRIVIIATAVIIVATLVVGGTLAFFTDKGEVKNVITMGNVQITLTEPVFEKLTSSTYKISNVMPNQKITKDPTITNTGDHDAYIRCKVTVTGLKGDQSAALIKGLDFENGWAKSGEYYYYQSPLPKKPADGISAVKLFDTVTIPENWDSTLDVGKDGFNINITAEAIQADNFTPHKTGTVIDGWKYSNSSDVESQPAPTSSSPVSSQVSAN